MGRADSRGLRDRCQARTRCCGRQPEGIDMRIGEEELAGEVVVEEGTAAVKEGMAGLGMEVEEERTAMVGAEEGTETEEAVGTDECRRLGCFVI